VAGHFEVSFLRGAVAEGQGIVAVVVFGQLPMHKLMLEGLSPVQYRNQALSR
jgi:hypothetical protein